MIYQQITVTHQFGFLKKRFCCSAAFEPGYKSGFRISSLSFVLDIYFSNYSISIVKLIGLLDFLGTCCLVCEDTQRNKCIWLLEQLQLASMSRTMKIHHPAENIWGCDTGSSSAALSYLLNRDL